MSQFPKIMLDSGAFSARRDEKPFTPQERREYAVYIFENLPYLEEYVTMDSILSHVETQRNHQALLRMGLKPTNVYHLGEPVELLDQMIKSNQKFGLGGLVGKGAERPEFIKSCAARIHLKTGLEVLPIHLFGVTDINILLSDRFASADSTTWVISAYLNKAILMPIWNNGQWDYSQQREVILGTQSEWARKNGHHPLMAYDPKMRSEIERYIADLGLELGESIIDARPLNSILGPREKWYSKKYQPGKVEFCKTLGVLNDDYIRAEANARYFERLSQFLEMDIYLSQTALNPGPYIDALVRAKVSCVLYSYAEVKKAYLSKADPQLKDFFNRLSAARGEDLL